MKELVIYEYQLKEIQKALDLTSKYLECEKRMSAYDRIVSKAREFTSNALEGEIDKRIKSR